MESVSSDASPPRMPYHPLTSNASNGNIQDLSVEDSATNRYSIPRKPLPSPSVSALEFLIPEAEKSGKLPRRGNLRGNVRRLHRWPLNVFKAWGVEIASCVVMVAMLVAIIATLLPHQNHPLPKWPYNLSINALISIWSTIMKAASVLVLTEGISQLKWNWITKKQPLIHLSRYDDASRGPWGCVWLLLTLRGRDLISTAGALIAIFLLAVDPFSQQLVRYANCQIASNSSVSALPRSNLFYELGLHAGAGITAITPPLIAAIDSGVFNPRLAQVEFDCSSGNCTFSETYSTIGFCAQCSDVSHELKFTGQDGVGIATTLPSGSFAWFTGKGDSQSERWFAMNASTNIHEVEVELIMAVTTVDPNASFEKAYYFAYLSGDDGYYTTSETETVCKPDWAQQTWGCRRVGAARCKLSLCARTYSGQVAEGKLQEKSVTNSSSWYIGAGGAGSTVGLYSQVDLSCLQDEQKQALRDRGYHVDNSSSWMFYNVALDPKTGAPVKFQPNLAISQSELPEPDVDIVPLGCLYSTNYESVEGITNYLENYFNVSIGPSTNTDSFIGPPQALALFNDSFCNIESISKVFENVAESLTVHMRSHNVQGLRNSINKPVPGIVWASETCVSVRWGWISYPAVIVLATLLFFISMLYHTERGRNGEQSHGWKSSLLPLVFLDMQGVEQEHCGELDITKIDNMRKFAEEVKVYLDHNDGLKARASLRPE